MLTVPDRQQIEAEYQSMANGICELLWIRGMLLDLRFHTRTPMQLYCDNKAAISIAQNPVQLDQTKHIEVDRRFIKEKLQFGQICIPFVRTGDQLAAIFTKGLSSLQFGAIVSKLGMHNIYMPT